MTFVFGILGGFVGTILALVFVVGVRVFRSARTSRKAMKNARSSVGSATRHTIHEAQRLIKEAMQESKQPWMVDTTIEASLEAMVLIGRTGVLEEFDGIASADAFVGFSADEWRGVQKFFEHNKKVSGWDKIQA